MQQSAATRLSLVCLIFSALGSIVTEPEPIGCAKNVLTTTTNFTISSLMCTTKEARIKRECNWTISKPAGSKVCLVTKSNLSVAESNGCCEAYLVVYDGTSPVVTLELGTWCGSGQLEPLLAEGSSLHVVFSDDAETKQSYFVPNYYIIAENDDVKCTPKAFMCTTTERCIRNRWVCGGEKHCNGGSDKLVCSTVSAYSATTARRSPCGEPKYLSNTSGEIWSANYGVSNYPPNVTCEWTLSVPGGKVVRLQFIDFRLEYSENCDLDYAHVYDGIDESSPLLKQACGSRRLDVVYSSGTNMHVVFVSDEDNTTTGFRATFSAVDPPPICQFSDFVCADGSCQPATSRCNGTVECSGGEDELFCEQKDCGTVKVRHMARIYGGTDAKPGSWPWQVMVKHNGMYVCGGSLIAPQWVITAAHCFDKKGNKESDWSVVAGKHSKLQTDAGEVSVNVELVLDYQRYNHFNHDGDLALIKLATPIPFSDTIGSICLPSHHVAPGSTCYVIGWGKTEDTEYSDVLKEVEILTMSEKQCVSNTWIPSITQNQFCAGWSSGGRDACQGDSGGPLACLVNGSFQLQGIVSFAIACATDRAPGVYTKVYNYVDWIKSTVARNSL